MESISHSQKIACVGNDGAEKYCLMHVNTILMKNPGRAH